MVSVIEIQHAVEWLKINAIEMSARKIVKTFVTLC